MSEDCCSRRDCTGCKFSRGHDERGEKVQVVHLPGGWCVNHYLGGERYLGWLALQPREHRCSIAELTNQERTSLGPNIWALDRAVSKYWPKRFHERIARLYFVYFFESARTHRFHVHLHLIPRFERMEGRLRAWSAPRATLAATFPDRYRPTHASFEQEKASLMEFLDRELSVRTGRVASRARRRSGPRAAR